MVLIDTYRRFLQRWQVVITESMKIHHVVVPIIHKKCTATAAIEHLWLNAKSSIYSFEEWVLTNGLYYDVYNASLHEMKCLHNEISGLFHSIAESNFPDPASSGKINTVFLEQLEILNDRYWQFLTTIQHFPTVYNCFPYNFYNF